MNLRTTGFKLNIRKLLHGIFLSLLYVNFFNNSIDIARYFEVTISFFIWVTEMISTILLIIIFGLFRKEKNSLRTTMLLICLFIIYMIFPNITLSVLCLLCFYMLYKNEEWKDISQFAFSLLSLAFISTGMGFFSNAWQMRDDLKIFPLFFVTILNILYSFIYYRTKCEEDRAKFQWRYLWEGLALARIYTEILFYATEYSAYFYVEIPILLLLCGVFVLMPIFAMIGFCKKEKRELYTLSLFSVSAFSLSSSVICYSSWNILYKNFGYVELLYSSIFVVGYSCLYYKNSMNDYI